MSANENGIELKPGGTLVFGEKALCVGVRIEQTASYGRYSATDTDAVLHEVVVASDEAALQRLVDDAKALGSRVVAPSPIHPLSTGGWAYQTSFKGMRSMADGLNQAVAARESNSSIQLVKDWVLPLVQLFSDLYSDGHILVEYNPENFMVTGDGVCRLRRAVALAPVGETPLAPRTRELVIGYSSPEMHGRCGGGVGPGSDVFFLGCVLYYFLARIRPLAEASDTQERLPPPNIFHDGIPPELVAVTCRAISPVIGRRQADVARLHEDLMWALSTAVRRDESDDLPSLVLEMGQEIHIGLLKGRSVPVNQDDLFVGYNDSKRMGLFVISDGVSISRYGTGDMASRCVRIEATRLWERLASSLGLDDTQTVSATYDDTMDGSLDGRSGTLPGHMPPRDERQALLRQMLDAANRRIGMTVEDQLPPGTDRPEGVMAATALALHLEDDSATFTYIGDSRIYLIRDGYLSRLSIDHNLCTQLIRMKRPPRVARSVAGRNALVRCVGDFERSMDGRLIPQPLQPEFGHLKLLAGDSIVMCSDGVVDYAGVDEESAEEAILNAVQSAPDAHWAAFELMTLANRGGGGDNISCIVLNFSEDHGR